MPRQPLQYLLLILIDSDLGGSDRARRSCLHLDEADCVALPRYQAKIAASAALPPSARCDHKSIGPQIIETSTLSAAPRFEMRRQPLLSRQSLAREAIAQIKRLFKE